MLAFAEAMEAKLRRHDNARGEHGWRDEHEDWLLDRLREETAELARAILTRVPDDKWRRRVLHEAADVANFAMMIADVCGGLHGE